MDNQMRITGFICNWGAYSALDAAGLEQRPYQASIRLVRLSCLSRLNSGLVLKAFEAGANAVLLLGCPPAQCHFHAGPENARKVIEQSRALLKLFGVPPERLHLVEAPAGDGAFLAEQIEGFIGRLGMVGVRDA